MQALVRRALELDESWNFGAIHVAMISLEALPASMGGDRDRAARHYERAVALTKGNGAGPHVSYATGVLLPQQKRAEFVALLEKALAVDVDRERSLRLENILAQQYALPAGSPGRTVSVGQGASRCIPALEPLSLSPQVCLPRTPLSAQGPIKIGTIAPQNSIYVKTLHQMGEGWKSRTNGRVTYTILAGGDESEEGLLRNMRPNFRKLHAAQLSAITLANLDDAFNVFGLPMFFESRGRRSSAGKAQPGARAAAGGERLQGAELGLRRVDSHLQQDSRHHGRRSQAAQAVHVDWRRPPGAVVQEERLHRRPDRQHRDHHVAQDLDDRGRSVPATLRPAPHVPVGALHDGPRVCFLGATVMSTERWNALSAEDQAIVVDEARKAGARLRTDVPRLDREALKRCVVAV